MPKPLNLPIRVVFYRDSGRWVAHCLEFDLLGDGDTHGSAIKSLSEAILIQLKESLRSNNPQNLFSPAPAEYWRKYAQGRNIADGSLRIEIFQDDVEIPGDDFREYEDTDSDSRLMAVS
jgi:hypothetical protein